MAAKVAPDMDNSCVPAVAVNTPEGQVVLAFGVAAICKAVPKLLKLSVSASAV